LAKKPAKDFTLDQLTHVMGNAEPGSQSHTEMLGELKRRQTIAQLEATEAQKAAAVAEQQAAQAAIETAKATRSNARWMFWAVIASVVSAIITAAGVAFNAFGSSCG